MLLPLACAGCAVGPNYVAPNVAVPESFEHAATASADLTDIPVAAWWRNFDDPVLDGLIDRALSGNIDIKIAASHIAEAQLLAIVARSSKLP